MDFATVTITSSVSHEAVQQEGEPSSHEKVKRKLKTPAQIEALEKFYNEHKYPSEAMKLEFAKKINLSEKQVSGWFCHRRLKDKKICQGEIYTNGKQKLSNSAIHDRVSGVKQESCSSTKQAERNLDSKEVESKMHYGYKSSFGVLACEPRYKHAHDGNNHVYQGRSLGSSSASHGSYLQSNENLCDAQPSRYKLWDDSSMLTSNQNTDTKSKEHRVNPLHSFFQDDNEASAVSLLKWKLGRYYHEDGPPLGLEFDPLPPGAFDSPVRDSKCEPYYVGDMQHGSSSFYRSISETRVYDTYSNENLSSNAYHEQRSFKKRKLGIFDGNEITDVQSTPNSFPSHARYQAIALDEAKKSTNQTSYLNVRNNLRSSKYKAEVGYDTKAGYNLHQNYQNSNIKSSFSYPNYDTEVFQSENLHTNSFVAAQKKYNSIDPGYWHQPQKLPKDNIVKETAKKIHPASQSGVLIKSRNNTTGKEYGVEPWRQLGIGKGLHIPAHQVPFIRNPWNIESHTHRDVSESTSSSLD